MFCYSPSAPNSANLTPVDNTNQSYADWNRVMQAGGGHGGHLVTNAYRIPDSASTASSGQGQSGVQPILEQPGQTTPMRYPAAELSAYGTMAVGQRQDYLRNKSQDAKGKGTFGKAMDRRITRVRGADVKTINVDG
ncbi:hypothetical protein VPNG_01359 [Cytospora leucostoma]|uniref:Uncharacterized protein n=1 Tax=Cytospora leucostoma TaxID=1230097 RepID=A0A423XLT9_9PEZI|nr:hypothetical protein VPNG_01359 [Cytospora leucostoma]